MPAAFLLSAPLPSRVVVLISTSSMTLPPSPPPFTPTTPLSHHLSPASIPTPPFFHHPLCLHSLFHHSTCNQPLHVSSPFLITVPVHFPPCLQTLFTLLTNAPGQPPSISHSMPAYTQLSSASTIIPTHCTPALIATPAPPPLSCPQHHLIHIIHPIPLPKIPHCA